MKMLKVLAVAALAGSATLAMADEKVVTEEGIATFSTFKPAQVRAEVGTTGYGGAVSWSVNPYTAVTLGYNGGDISWTDDLSVNGTKYDLDMDNNNVYLNAEIRPFANWLYVAAGVAYIDNDYDVTQIAKAGGDIKLDGSTFTVAAGQGVNGQVQYKESFVPYLGLGVSPAITSRIGLFGEVGAYYTGNPTIKLNATDPAILTTTDNTGRTLAVALAEEENRIKNETKFEFLPVAKVGLSVRF